MAYKITQKLLREATSFGSTDLVYAMVSERVVKFMPRLELNDNAIVGSWARNMNVLSGTGFQEVYPGYFAAAAWGQGFSLQRLNDDGSTTELVYDASPFSPLRNYNYYGGLAVGDNGLRIFVTNYVYRNMAEYIFTDHTYTSYTKNVYAGGTSYDGGTTTFPNADFGKAHRNGTIVCGDWIYFSVDSYSEGADKPMRWNWRTKKKEILDWNYGRDNYSLSNRYSDFSYHKETDTLLGHGWYRTYYIFDASTNDPKSHVVQNYTGGGYWQGSGFFSKNKTWRAYGRGGIIIDDITNLRANKDASGYDSTTAATYVTNYEYGMQDGAAGFTERGYGRIFMGESTLVYDPKGDTFYATTDRGTNRSLLFWDKYNFTWVGLSQMARYAPHPKQALNGNNNYVAPYGDGAERFYDYCAIPLKLKSYGNQTEYWLNAVYTRTNRVWEGSLAETPYQKKKLAIAVFNNFEHDDGTNVEYVRLRMLKNGVKKMPNSEFIVYVRSDSNPWQEYEFDKYGEYLLKLDTAGRYIDVKFEMYGDGINIAYYYHYETPILEMESDLSETRIAQVENLETKRNLANAKQKRRFRNRIRKIGR